MTVGCRHIFDYRWSIIIILPYRQTNQKTNWLTEWMMDLANCRAVIAAKIINVWQYWTISLLHKAIVTCRYRLTYITICRATIAAKPTNMNTYSDSITVKHLLCIITFYCNTILILKLWQSDQPTDQQTLLPIVLLSQLNNSHAS